MSYYYGLPEKYYIILLKNQNEQLEAENNSRVQTIKPLAPSFHISGTSLESFKKEVWPDL